MIDKYLYLSIIINDTYDRYIYVHIIQKTTKILWVLNKEANYNAIWIVIASVNIISFEKWHPKISTSNA
jgi:hypothetical protein